MFYARYIISGANQTEFVFRECPDSKTLTACQNEGYMLLDNYRVEINETTGEITHTYESGPHIAEYPICAGQFRESLFSDNPNKTYYFKYCVSIGDTSNSARDNFVWASAILAVGAIPSGTTGGTGEPTTASGNCANCSNIAECLGCIDKDKFVLGIFEPKN